MSTTIREQILVKIVDNLDNVTIANGFNSNIGLTVFRCLKSVDPNDLPCIVLWPKVEDATRNYGKVICDMPIRIEAFSSIGLSSISGLAEIMLGDIIKTMGVYAAASGNLANDVLYLSGGCEEYPESNELVLCVTAEYNIKYEYKIGNPYTQ